MKCLAHLRPSVASLPPSLNTCHHLY